MRSSRGFHGSTGTGPPTTLILLLMLQRIIDAMIPIQINSMKPFRIQTSVRSFACRRSLSKASSRNDGYDSLPSSVRSLLANVLSRATRSLSVDAVSSDTKSSNELRYGQNPAISTTALAHMIWKQILRPGIDSAIDATAGNGGDSLVMAQLLFHDDDDDDQPGTSQLVCVDIDASAVANTGRLLKERLPPEAFQRVSLLRQSHSPLPLPNDTSSVGLVAYNLGFLPKSDKQCQTSTESTLTSMRDAVLALRVGGLLSVLTYPRSNREEHEAVVAFVTGLALFSSVTDRWDEYVQEQLHFEQSSTKNLTDQCLRHVHETGAANQTWRVHEHSKLGWREAPVLLTAVRVK